MKRATLLALVANVADQNAPTRTELVIQLRKSIRTRHRRVSSDTDIHTRTPLEIPLVTVMPTMIKTAAIRSVTSRCVR